MLEDAIESFEFGVDAATHPANEFDHELTFSEIRIWVRLDAAHR
ncbi:hypothetical protein [Herbiconiux daphne]|uniref:Uncharacterized protein n=1 Tax=Herbiconiux daphne TaxID=2970914 RepID=A0ABT2H6N9_9MICO|nr:hypothetical protein [Herbiconiux daphne]MCS5735587.1 hypothetical protein [Herbiconiux daphne]